MAFKKISFWRTVKIHLKLSYQRTILNSLHLIRLRAQFVDFARRSLNKTSTVFFFSLFRRNIPQWTMASSFLRFLDHTKRRITVGRTPVDEWSARRRDLYLTPHDTHNMPPVGFEPTISAGERRQTYALDRAAKNANNKIWNCSCNATAVHVPYTAVALYTIMHSWRSRGYISHFWIKATTPHDKKKVQCVWPELNYRRPLREKWLRHERYYNHFDFQEFLNNILPLRCSMPNYERSQTRWTATQNAIDFRWAFRGHRWVKYTKFTRRFFREFYSCIELENKTIDCIMKATITVKPSAVAFALCFSPTQIAS